MSRVARRIVLALLLAALLPLGAAVVLALMLTEVSLGVGLNETVRRGLSNDIPLYRSLFDAKKAAYQSATDALMLDPRLHAALVAGDDEELRRMLETALHDGRELHRAVLTIGERRIEASRHAEPGSRPLILTRVLPEPPEATLEVEFRLPARYVRGLEEARGLAETYQTLASARENITRSLLLSFAAVLLVVLLGSVLAGLMLARGVTRRVARLAAATAVVADGDLSVRVDEQGRDEIAELGRAFNTMVTELEERRDRIIYLEKISGWQEVARRLAHEIKNPLTPIVLAVQQLDEKKPTGDPDYEKLVRTAREIVDEEVASLRHLVEEFSSFAKLPQVRPEPVELTQYLEEVGDQLITTTPGAEVALEIAEELGTVGIDRMMLRRVITNLATNAVEAQEGQPPPAQVRLIGAADERAFFIAIEDGGPGIEPELIGRVFEPYVTGKEHGTGLGLAIVKKIVLQHGGTITAGVSPTLGGARFEIRLPRAALTAAQGKPG